MGNSQSPPSDPRFAAATRAFTQKELDDLKSLFTSLANQSQSNSKFITLSVFQEYFGLKGALGERLFDLVTQQRKDNKLNFQDFIIAKSVYEKGTKDEIEGFIYKLLDVTNDGNLSRSDLETVVIAALMSAFPIKDSEHQSNYDPDIVEALLNAATFSKEVSSEKCMSIEDFRSWCSLLPSLRKFLGGLLTPPDADRPGTQVPRLVHGEDFNPNLTILRMEYAWLIGGALSHNELDEWKLLYHSAISGLSFNTFIGSISNGEGPTVLIVKDKEGYIYGGFASQPWERHGDFYGDMKCFLFQLYPKASIFKPTGANNNLQWCAVNFSSDTIPNGIGFGGRVNHFGLFISASFDQGQTFSCTTFGSPCLSKTNRIVPEVIECWGVVQNGSKDNKHDAIRGTVLERFKEDRHMLNMVGLANASE